LDCKLTPVKNEEFSLEGSTVTLSYSYPELLTSNYFFWYRQHPGKQPQLLVGHGASGSIGNALRSGLKISVEQKEISMNISSVALTDSAVYYCAVKEDNTTSTRGTNNLQWYQQDPGSAPQFLLLITDTSDPTVVTAKPPHPRLTVKLNEERNRVDLQISSAVLTDSAVYSNKAENAPGISEDRFKAAINGKSVPLKIQKLQLTDSAVYYCALRPTVTGNTTTLYKNLWREDNTILHNIH
uniref:Ig-like domain-containing protein n=1 Tax=Labrus bergylta TaxID=56723 RepID=A0A3Q3EUA3_9LABR